MYYVYMDEAGTSAKEPVTVVTGVVLHADRHWRAAVEMLQSAFDFFVPQDLRDGFHFHAKEIWSGYRDHSEVWPRERRAEFIGAVASIPRRMEMAVSLGKVRRECVIGIEHFGINQTGIDLEKQYAPIDLQHFYAFGCAIRRANKYVRDWAAPNEVATIVAEDVKGKRAFLQRAVCMPPADYPLEAGFIRLTKAERETGRIVQNHAGPIDRIIDTVHFVEKKQAPLLQLADACAFSFRRYFAGQAYGDVMVRDLFGGDLVWEDFQGPLSEQIFSFHPDHVYPKIA